MAFNMWEDEKVNQEPSSPDMSLTRQQLNCRKMAPQLKFN